MHKDKISQNKEDWLNKIRKNKGIDMQHKLKRKYNKSNLLENKLRRSETQ